MPCTPINADTSPPELILHSHRPLAGLLFIDENGSLFATTIMRFFRISCQCGYDSDHLDSLSLEVNLLLVLFFSSFRTFLMKLFIQHLDLIHQFLLSCTHLSHCLRLSIWNLHAGSTIKSCSFTLDRFPWASQSRAFSCHWGQALQGHSRSRFASASALMGVRLSPSVTGTLITRLCD